TGRVQEVARSEMPFRYTIQVGAFLDRESALKMAAFWHRKGYDAYLLELYGIKDPSRLWQSVRIGRFDSVVEGRRFLEQFRAKEKSDGYLASSDSFAPPKEMALTAGLGWDARKTAGKPQVSGVESQSKNKIGPVVPSDRKSPVDDPMVMAREAVVPTGEGHLENQGGGVKPTEETPVQSKDGVGEISSDSNGKDGDELSVEQVVGAGLDVKGEPMPAVTKSGSDLGPAVLSAKDGKPEGNDLATGAAPSVASPVEGLKVDLGQIAEKSTASQGQVPGKAENLSGPGRGDAQHLFDQAMREEKEGRMDDAQGLYRQILERDPGHVLARQRLARIYVEAGRTSEALALLKPAVAGRDSRSLASADPNFSAFLAALYQRQEEHWKAVDLYEALLQNDPNKGIWQMGMAISLEKLNEPANALRYYEKSLESGELSVRLRTFVEKRVRNLK
ncbi:MAG TPA: tetratricopeptide repeat protein, partial [Magnetococcales bacterium]|nr:tetratricopeptide repeat protein [Magnetococcales bacterium]